MKTQANLTSKEAISGQIAEIISLYKEFNISVLLNDLVAIGTWPTPEQPEVKQKDNFKGGSVKIDTVPLPDRPTELKKILGKLVKDLGNPKIKDIVI